MESGLRERKKLRTHGAITDAALRLFAERGFDGTTVDDIAAAADVSRRTFFRYFARKEDVLIGWKQEMAGQLGDALAARPASEPPLTAVQAALTTVIEGYATRPDLMLGLVRLFESAPTLHTEAGYASWDDVLSDGLAQRLGVDPARDKRPRLVATVGFAIVIAALHGWGSDGGSGDLIERVDAGFAALRSEAAGA